LLRRCARGILYLLSAFYPPLTSGISLPTALFFLYLH